MAGDWYEQPVATGESVEFQLFNNDNANEPLFVFDAHFFLSDTLIPLDDLNNLYEPPAGSNFAPLPGIPDGTEIAPGSHAEAGDITVPEPSTAFLLSAGIPMLLAWRHRNGRKAWIF